MENNIPLISNMSLTEHYRMHGSFTEKQCERILDVFSSLDGADDELTDACDNIHDSTRHTEIRQDIEYISEGINDWLMSEWDIDAYKSFLNTVMHKINRSSDDLVSLEERDEKVYDQVTSQIGDVIDLLKGIQNV